MIIAITGGIGCGKSSVAAYLVKKTMAEHCDTDQYCMELLAKGQPGWKDIKAKWENRFITSEGSIDRPLLRKAIFNNKDVRRDLEAILHPRVILYVEQCMEKCRKNRQTLVVEVPLLFEVGWQEKFDKVVTVIANIDECIKRVVNRDGVSAQEVEKAINAQISLDEKAKLSDHVIDNSGYWEETCRHVDNLVRCLNINIEAT